MSIILCIETGTDVCSVALASDGKMFALRESGQGRDHARNVAVYVEEILAETRIEAAELDAVAVGKGPGSYTGLRIGVSFAKGLCYALRIPLIGIGSTESLARVAMEEHEAGVLDAANWDGSILCPMIDARRMEVYTQLFDTSLRPLTEVSALIVAPDSFDAFISSGHEFLIFGDGAAKCAEVLPREGIRLVDIGASARGLCSEAQRRLDAGITEETAYFEPLYLKDFVTTSKKKIF